MGRPAKTEPRNQQLNLSLSISEFETIKRRADVLGVRPAHLGRSLVLSTNASAIEREKPSSNLDKLIYSQIVRLGNNLNQLVRHLHKTGDPLPPDLEPLLIDIRQIIERARR